jgi:hypothetical protein
MPGFTRRSKPLKATSLLGDITDFSISNAAEGDLLVFDDVQDIWSNTKALTGDYTVTGAWNPTTLTSTGDITAGDDLIVNTDLSVGGNSSLTGALTVVGAGTFDTTLTVTGAATLSSTLNLADTLTGAGFSFGTGTMTALTVTTLTATNLNFTNLALSGTLSVAGTSLFSDIAVFDAAVTINADLAAQNIAGSSLSASGPITGTSTLDIAKGGWSASGQNLTLALKGSTGTYSITGIQTDLTVQTMLTLDPDAHHILGGVDGVLIPTGTTAQEPTGAAGMIRFDTDTAKFMGYEAAWAAFAMADDLHTRSHTMTSTSDHSAGTWKTFYSDGSGNLIELALGASGDVLTAGGAAAAPTWETPAGGGGLTNFQDNGLAGEGLYNSVVTMTTTSTGLLVSPSTGTNTILDLFNSGLKGRLAHDNTDWAITNFVNSGHLLLQGRDAGSVTRNLFLGDADAGAELFFAGVKKLETLTNGVEVQSRLIVTQDQDAGLNLVRGSQEWRVYIENSDDSLTLYNTTGADIGIKIVPNGACFLYYNGIQGQEVANVGTNFRRTTGATTVNRLKDASGNNEWGCFSTTTSGYTYTYVHGGTNRLWAENASGVAKLVFHGDPDNTAILYYAGVAALETISGSIKFGTRTAIGAETITGYITIQDSGGTSRKLAVVS